MKKISQIAKETGQTTYVIRYLIEREKIIPYRNGLMKLDKNQEALIHKILFFEGKLIYLTFESKINDRNLRQTSILD